MCAPLSPPPPCHVLWLDCYARRTCAQVPWRGPRPAPHSPLDGCRKWCIDSPLCCNLDCNLFCNWKNIRNKTLTRRSGPPPWLSCAPHLLVTLRDNTGEPGSFSRCIMCAATESVSGVNKLGSDTVKHLMEVKEWFKRQITLNKNRWFNWCM